jgi:hypothetical protein
MAHCLRIFTLGCLFSIVLVQIARAQVTVTGVITDKDNKLVLPYASVFNKNTNKRATSDQGGFYKIAANRNDILVFSFLGYKSDTIRVLESSGTETLNIKLEVEGQVLRGVEVKAEYSPYQLDSIARREQYGNILNRSDNNLIGGNGNTPEGFGITFSPISRYSRKEKQKREFKKLFEKMEREKFIDSRYTPLLVSQVTGLKGDSLQLFMRDNYPDYETMRVISREDLLYWITDKYKAWKK